jgi:hypothetical protein
MAEAESGGHEKLSSKVAIVWLLSIALNVDCHHLSC